MTKQRHRARAFGLTTIVAGVLLAVTGFSAAPASAAVNDHQIEICHATSSGSNPYTTPTPNKWQITAPNGHGTLHDDDIIPPFAAGSHGGHSWDAYPGKNWDAAGQQIWADGCNVIPPGSGTVTLDKVTAGDGQPLDTTDFTFSVVCDDAVVSDPAPVLSPEDPAAVVAAEVVVETSCTIGENAVSDPGFVSATFSVDGGPEVAGPVTVTMDQSEQVISVVVTNTYQCVAPLVPDGAGGCVPPVVVTDACPAVEGVQTDTTLCPPAVEGTAVTTTTSTTSTTTAAVAGADVLGEQVVASAELPRTGSGTSRLALLGLGLVLLGAGALLVGRDEHLVTS